VGRFSVGEPAEVFKRFDSAPEVEPLEGLGVKGGGRLGGSGLDSLLVP